MHQASTAAIWRGVRLAAALAWLNISVSFVSIWPTLGVRPTWLFSAEAAGLAAGLALAWVAGHGRVSRRTEGLLALLWVPLIIARYLEVSTRALYGRSVNLYWDLKLLPDVGAMFAFVAHPGILLALAAGVLLVPLLLYLPVRWAIAQVSGACASAALRRMVLASAGLVLAAAPLAWFAPAVADLLPVAPPVSASIARELAEFAGEAAGRTRQPLPPAVPMTRDMAFVRGADVLVLFIESYGMTSWERPEFQPVLAPARAGLASAIADTGRTVVTAMAESTTFGGESWLAHISFLSGTEVRDAEVNRRLLADTRDTLVTAFSRAGYRTLGIFPGLHTRWPEGGFYGFDRIYGAPDLAYQGPPFGWWDVTDQFVLARLDALNQAESARAPLFAFLPTISTHTPFTPVPPYQPDWDRVLTPTPYDDAVLNAAYDATPDWSNLGPDYARALAYAHETVGGYLRRHAGRDLVVVMLGDHQPPALVSGEGASWNVPVHVIASRPLLLERLRARGFSDGLAPHGPVLARMDALTAILLDAFGNPE